MSRADGVGLLVVGDMAVDVLVTPDEDLRAVGYTEGSVLLTPGGSGFNLARAGRENGFSPVSLVCGLGDPGSFPARFLAEELRSLGIELISEKNTAEETGAVFVGYLPDGSRAMVAAPNANRNALTEHTVAAANTVRAPFVLVSGYMLFRASTREGTLEIMHRAAARGARVALDIVPHSVNRWLRLAELRSLLGPVDFLAGEHKTFAAFGAPPELLLDDVRGVLMHTLGDRYHVHTRSGIAEGDFPRPSDATERRGLTDRLLVSTLREHFISL
ncbi:carbohydrate kinase family protein [Streptomyces sp. NPDC054962]